MTGPNSELMRELIEGRFVFTGEIEPSKTTSLQGVLEAAKKLKGHVVAANVTDNPTAYAYMNALIPSYIIQREVGLEAVYQMTVRDRNRLALTSDLLGAGALGIRNILVLSGDHTAVGEYPGAKPVYDLDSTNMVELIRRMVDRGVDLGENRVIDPPKFHIGIASNPNADPLEPEVFKIERKVMLGAEFIQTQAVYDVEVAKGFLDAIAYLNRPVLIGVAPFKSISAMEWMMRLVPGIIVPEEIQSRLRRARERGGKEEFYRESIEIFGQLAHDVRKTTKAKGIHLMTIGFEWIVPSIIERSIGA
jgi:5,10-methylenetetrahydrofolate reductase